MRGCGLSYGARRLLVHVAAALALFGGAPALAAERLVLAFGDSLTAGYGLKPAEAFPAQLERALKSDGVPVRVHNAGVSGDTSAAGRARLGWVLNGLKTKPDLVIVELGGNDMLRGLRPAETRANIEAILLELKRRRVPVLLAGMLASPNMGPDFRRSFDRIFPDLARKHGARLYPFFMKGVAGQRGLLLPDGMHPNARGVGVIVRGIAPQVKGALGPKG